MAQPPWIVKPKDLFPTENTSTGNAKPNHKLYNNEKWRKTSKGFLRGKTCCHPNCMVLATVTDHIIPAEKGGAFWDRRNWQPMCDQHHNIKRGKERHGFMEEAIKTENGLIPKRNANS